MEAAVGGSQLRPPTMSVAARLRHAYDGQVQTSGPTQILEPPQFTDLTARRNFVCWHVTGGRHIAARDPSSGSFAVCVNLRHDDAVEPFLDAEFVYQALAQRGDVSPRTSLSARTSCAAEDGVPPSSQRTGSVRPIAGKNHLQSRSSASASTAKVAETAKAKVSHASILSRARLGTAGAFSATTSSSFLRYGWNWPSGCDRICSASHVGVCRDNPPEPRGLAPRPKINFVRWCEQSGGERGAGRGGWCPKGGPYYVSIDLHRKFPIIRC